MNDEEYSAFEVWMARLITVITIGLFILLMLYLFGVID